MYPNPQEANKVDLKFQTGPGCRENTCPLYHSCLIQVTQDMKSLTVIGEVDLEKEWVCKVYWSRRAEECTSAVTQEPLNSSKCCWAISKVDSSSLELTGDIFLWRWHRSLLTHCSRESPDTLVLAVYLCLHVMYTLSYHKCLQDSLKRSIHS